MILSALFRRSGAIRRVLGVIVASLILVASRAEAGGFYLPNQGVEATARGNAWVATADSPSAVHYNPAGLSQIRKPSVEVGVYAIQTKYTLESEISGETYKTNADPEFVPHLYYAHPLKEGLVLGVGISSPFGLSTDWGSNTPFRNLSTEASLKYLRLSGVLSMEVLQGLSVGGGLAVDYADATFERGIPNLQFPDDRLRFEGHGTALTWLLGVRWQPHEQHAFGLVYRSAANFELDGDLSGSPAGIGLPAGSARSDFYTPATAVFGYSFRPNDRLNLEVNVEWVDWDGLNTLRLHGSNIGDPIEMPFLYESSWIYMIGGSYDFDDQWRFSTGYVYNENAVSDSVYNPAVPDSNLQSVNLGLSCLRGSLTLRGTYQFAWSDHKVNSSTVPNVLGNGDYSSRHHAVMLGVQWDF